MRLALMTVNGDAKDDHIIIYSAQTVSDVLSHLPMGELTETEEGGWIPFN